MNLNKVNNKVNYLLIGLLSILSILRVYIGYKLPYYYYVDSNLDDLFFIRHSDLINHFTLWNPYTLSKYHSFSLFLFFVNHSGIPYSIIVSILWLIAGLFVVYALYKFVTDNKLILALVYLFIIFIPTGFNSASIRIYRNSIMFQFALITMCSLFIFINKLISKEEISTNNKIIWGIITGLFFTFNYYIKEDSMVLLPILLVSIFAILIFKLVNHIKNNSNSFTAKSNLIKVGKIIIVCLIPILIFAAGTLAYEEIDNHYFGVAEINTRNGGEFGEFYKLLLKIDDNNKNTSSWVPYSTMKKAYDASPTLQSHPELLESLTTSSWAEGDYHNHTPPGDLSGWMIMSSLMDVDLYKNEKEVNDLFKQVNNELNNAFDNGTPEKSDKIFITSSLNGKSIEEINELSPLFIIGLQYCLFYEFNDMDTGMSKTSLTFYSNDYPLVESVLNQKLVTVNNSYIDSNVVSFANFDFTIYHYVSYIIVLLSIIGFIGTAIYQIKNRFKNRSFNVLLGFEILLLGTFLVYIFAIAWFSISQVPSTNSSYMVLYAIPTQALIILFEILSILGFFSILKSKN